MRIYRADLHDLAACLALDGSYETDFVWQVTQQSEDNQVATRFRTIRLPRTMRVPYPSWGEALLAHQERGDLILVGQQGLAPARIGDSHRPGQANRAKAGRHLIVF